MHFAGCTTSPDERWMKQVARNLTASGDGFLAGTRYVLMDRDAKFSAAFRSILEGGSYDIRTPFSPPGSAALPVSCDRETSKRNPSPSRTASRPFLLGGDSHGGGRMVGGGATSGSAWPAEEHAGVKGGGQVGSPRWRRILAMTSGSVRKARTAIATGRLRVEQRVQASASTSSRRRRSCAQRRRWGGAGGGAETVALASLVGGARGAVPSTTGSSRRGGGGGRNRRRLRLAKMPW